MTEDKRVHKPGDYDYISDHVYAGAFNDILRMFHDAEKVPFAAFAAVKRVVESHMTCEGANFAMPTRVDILQKPFD